ncbi:MAG: TetR/AcrR family transcriptional regulator [Bacteroidales bacterium]|nr:TetR/AcrR family transcriptional regulator [Deltaproteobacteria bacterium]MBL7137798.1 TetR/AcrR family transcriptional regulator [Bacteroidales bacterium]
MSPKTKEQYAKIREDRRELILKAALELFASQGISHTTIHQIAKKAGISKGLIYNYFTSKEELLEEIIKSSIEHLYAFFDPDHDGILTTEEMEYFIEQQIKMLKQNIDFWKFLYMLLVQPSAQKLVHQLQFEILASGMWKMIASYFRNHKFEDPELETWFFHSMLDGVYMNYVFNAEKYPIDRMKELIIQRYCKP